jgi:hypothetical protein
MIFPHIILLGGPFTEKKKRPKKWIINVCPAVFRTLSLVLLGHAASPFLQL